MKKTIAIGIPVYNEENNIKTLLDTLSFQDIKINELFIIDDGSTDKTLNILHQIFNKSFKKINVSVISLEKNMGKANALNLIFKKAKSDYLFLLDSDIYFIKSNTLKSLIKCVDNNKNSGLVCGWYDIKLNDYRNFICRSYRFSAKLLKGIAMEKNIYGATGALMLLPKSVYKKLFLKENIYRIDAYIYLFVKSINKKFIFNPKAEVMLTIPKNERIHNFIKKQYRSNNIPDLHKTVFNSDILKEFKRPNTISIFYYLILNFIKSPIDGISYLILKSISYVLLIFKKPNIDHKFR